jgi:hypothetical protein
MIQRNPAPIGGKVNVTPGHTLSKREFGSERWTNDGFRQRNIG